MKEQKDIRQMINSRSGVGGFVGLSIYFIGIGGIGMSALARYFKNRGATVSGYDRSITPLTRELETEGVDVHFDEDVDVIPKDADVVVYTPAVPEDHKELAYYRDNNYTVAKRSDVLQWITEGTYNICVGGTHGKTTITTMIAHVLRDSGYGCNAFLGGISANYQTNFWPAENDVMVVEADEYDRSFLKLKPNVAVITAMDPDHLDIYGTHEEVMNAFIAFSKKIKAGGCLVSKCGLERSEELTAETHFTYSYDSADADVYATNIEAVQGSYTYDVQSEEWRLPHVELHMGGSHNIENSVAAITVAKYLRIDDDKIKKAIANFKGVKRRFEYVLKNDKHILIDDYAHHPAELKALLSGVKNLYDEECTVIFQPHLYSRTNDLAPEFARSLDLADQVILLPIYPARELPMEGVTSEIILNEMTLPQKQILAKNAMLDWVRLYKPKLLVMCGAGDIDALVEPVKEILTE